MAQPTTIAAGDQVIFFNFRSDRCGNSPPRSSEHDFSGFDRGATPPASSGHDVDPLRRGPAHAGRFSRRTMWTIPLARVLSEAGLTQFHCAETEKYAHVTFFFNGGREDPFPGEIAGMIPSPKVATYDLQPEMSAIGVTDQVVAAIDIGSLRFVIVNFANCDMVGHTGVFAAAVRAVETVDACLGAHPRRDRSADGVALVTADHGNAEEMIDRITGGPMTAHTTNPVPVILVTPEDHPLRHADLHGAGVLSSVAPTVLRILGVDVPPSMTSTPLV